MYQQFLDFKKLVFATHNNGKIKELNLLFKQSIFNNIEILKASDFSIIEPKETGITFKENALIKAKYVATQTKLPSIADDSGLCIDSLDGFPGFRSAELAEELGKGKRDFNKAMQYILNKLQMQNNRKAKFVSCLCLYIIGKEPLYFMGDIKGNISNQILGDNGFGYDPIFIPENSKLTFGQMSIEQKNSYPTHRAQAMQNLLNYMEAKI